MTILLVEQNTRIALKYTHWGCALETGRILLEGMVKELAQNEKVKKAYLGD
jgi:branched-chain amino acid transport system ATP-binding protein